jgi:GNAT superfamily N-acetyltransferase
VAPSQSICTFPHDRRVRSVAPSLTGAASYCRCQVCRKVRGCPAPRVFVVTEADSPVRVAYYAWCMAQVDVAGAPERLRKGAGGYPQPVARLARLGVDVRHERRGLGAALLQDVFARLLDLSTEIGCRGLLVHAESDEARDFYLHLIPEFEQSPTDPLHLFLLLKDVRRTLRR